MDTISFLSDDVSSGAGFGAGEDLARRASQAAADSASSVAPLAERKAILNDYYVTFRFSGDGAAERRERLLAALKESADEQSWWDETGAFVLFQSKLDILAIRRLAETVALSADFVLIGMVYVMRWELIGTAHDKSMFKVLRHTDGFA